MNIFCQKHPTENLYYGQATLDQIQTLMPSLLFSKLKGNNITINIRELTSDAVMFNGISFEVAGKECDSYGYLTINPDCVDCSVAASSPVGNQADGGEIFNVTFQSFKKKASVRLPVELINEILTFPVSDDFDDEEEHYEGAYELVARLKDELNSTK